MAERTFTAAWTTERQAAWKTKAARLRETSPTWAVIHYAIAEIEHQQAALAAERQKVQALVEELNNIEVADWRSWSEEVRSADEFVKWAKSRARYALAALDLTPDPPRAEP